MRSSKTGRKTSSLASTNVANILLFNFCEQKFVQNGPITIAIDCNGFSMFIFEEKEPNYASGPKSAPKSDSCWVRRLFNVCVWDFCAPNATILLVYISAKIKTSFIWKDVFFFCQNRQSRSQTHFPALFKSIRNNIRSAEGQNELSVKSDITKQALVEQKMLDGGPYM